MAASSACGAEIRVVGALGNSGAEGSALVRATNLPLEDCATGVAVDSDWVVYVSGGDAINRLGLDGRLIDRIPLEPPAAVASRTFAVVAGRLVFLARGADRATRLYACDMKAGASAAPLALALPPRKRDYLPYCLAPQALEGQALLACEPKDAADDRIAVYRVDLAGAKVVEMFRVGGNHPAGLAYDPAAGRIYLGGMFGLFVGGTTHQSLASVAAYDATGKPAGEGFPAPCIQTPATPTQFRGQISLAGGAMWDSAWYGFLARLDGRGAGDPGRIAEWQHELDYPTQIAGLLDGLPGAATRPARTQDPLLIATPTPDALYLAAWDRAGGRLNLLRRFGCLPRISGLALSDDGWAVVSTARTTLWYRWDDACDAVPRKAELHVAATPGVFREGRLAALGVAYRLQLRPQPIHAMVFSPHVGANNEARRVSEKLPFAQPVGFAVQAAPGKHDARALVVDAATKQVYAAPFWLPELRPQGQTWQPIAIEGLTLQAPTDAAALTDGRLLLADAGRLLLLEPAPTGAAHPAAAGAAPTPAYRVAWQFEKWGEAPADRLGGAIRFALDGPHVLISDTQRSRLVLLDWTQRRVLGQLGAVDSPGSDLDRLDHPAQVALAGLRALVADAGNQRILKITLAP